MQLHADAEHVMENNLNLVTTSNQKVEAILHKIVFHSIKAETMTSQASFKIIQFSSVGRLR